MTRLPDVDKGALDSLRRSRMDLENRVDEKLSLDQTLEALLKAVYDDAEGELDPVVTELVVAELQGEGGRVERP